MKKLLLFLILLISIATAVAGNETVTCAEGTVEVCHLSDEITKVCVGAAEVAEHLGHEHALEECSTETCKGNKALVCHVPPGNPSNSKALCVNLNSIEQHVDHGDYVGICSRCIPSEEICDGKDNDCDGKIDEEVTRSCGKSDVGTCSLGTETCQRGNWGRCSGAVYPDEELCDGKDNDCDGSVDEIKRSCGSIEGQCTLGSEECISGEWLGCTGILPADEVCDLVDNDCDGEIDEGCECQSGETRACGTDEGACQAGVQDCVFGKWKACLNAVEPTAEICDNIDNDCDGTIDEFNQECGDNFIGECEKGNQLCSAGEWGACEGQTLPRAELCDGKDNDCDGSIDESLTKTCGDGSQRCEDGAWSQCTGISIIPSLECIEQTEDGLVAHVIYENNNPGEIYIDVGDDNSFSPAPMDRGQPVAFNPGSESFTIPLDETITWNLDGNKEVLSIDAISCNGEVDKDGDGYTDDCDDSNPNVYPGALEICDNIDNNCNGEIDESLTKTCGTNKGECSAGIQTCSFGEWGSCEGAVLATIELCDGKDNDCDGVVDKISQSCGTDVGACQEGIEVCTQGAWGECDALGAIEEICDAVDNDCDGIIDEDCSCEIGETKMCGSHVGSCSVGIQTCTAEGWSDCDAEGPSVEICDGLDNDCDGTIDEHLVESCGSSDIGICSFGSRSCVVGNWSECNGDINSKKEICDGKDNDCNGVVDNGCTSSFGQSKAKKQEQRILRGSTDYLKELIIIPNLQPSIDLVDQQFTLEFTAKNLGNVALNDIKINLDLPKGWETVPITLDLPQEKSKSFSFPIKNRYFEDIIEESFTEKNFSFDLTANSHNVLIEQEYDIPFYVDDFTHIFPLQDFKESYALKTCYVIDNYYGESRPQLEVEFQIFDQKRDVFVDFVSAISADPDSVKIYCDSYNLQKSYIIPKSYYTESYLFESGSIFRKSYIQGKSQKVLNLEELERVKPSFIERFIRGLLG